jgi:hypothetical protein
MTADLLHRYNHHRLHDALGSVPPVEYRVTNSPTSTFEWFMNSRWLQVPTSGYWQIFKDTYLCCRY